METWTSHSVPYILCTEDENGIMNSEWFYLCELLYVITSPESLITMIQSNYMYFNHIDI